VWEDESFLSSVADLRYDLLLLPLSSPAPRSHL
jgi:hypothetical protein